MIMRKRWSFGLGTIFSLIVVYFIYLYSRGKGWKLLAFASKWYLIIVGSVIAISIGLVLLIIIVTLLMFLFAMLKLHSFGRKNKNHKSKEYIDAEYKIKE